jgi:hypothetical protein
MAVLQDVPKPLAPVADLSLPRSWQGYSQYAFEALPLPTASLPGGQVLAFRDYALEAYYKNPRYLDMIRTVFGLDTASHILDMAMRPLPSQYAESFISTPE